MKPVRRHFVNLMRRPDPSQLDGHGQPVTEPITVASNINCSIESLTGRELEQARTVVSNATTRVRMFISTSWNMTTKDWLIFGNRKLNIGHIGDDEQTEREYTLLCGEEV